MGLNDTVSAERIHIGFFGMRNAGKSSLVNAVTGQELSVVSPIKGTTTDPVKKAMELLPLGPVLIIDTAGTDDEGELGEKRKKKTEEVLESCHVAVLVADASSGLSKGDEELIDRIRELKLPYIIVFNKSDLVRDRDSHRTMNAGYEAAGDGQDREALEETLYVSALTMENVDLLKERIGALAKTAVAERYPVRDLVMPDKTVVLVVPIDESAPKGRIILPQQLVMRDLLDGHVSFMVCQHTELKRTLDSLREPPGLVITDSQVFGYVAGILARDVPLTSFSILMARYRGDLDLLIKGAEALEGLTDSSRVLISEACTHHRQCNDIGSVKIPGLIKEYTGACPVFSYSSGGGFPKELSEYDLVIHCGGCMINEKEMKNRLLKAQSANVPIVNYGMAIARMQGILDRCLEPLIK